MTDETYGFGEKTAKKLYEFSKSTFPYFTGKGPNPEGFLDPPIIFRNDYEDEAPAYGCLQITGAELDPDTDRYVVTVTRPDDTKGSHYIINGSAEVKTNEYGVGYSSGVLRVLIDSSEVELDAVWGPIKDQFTVGEDSIDPLIIVYGQIEDTPRPKMIYGLYTTDVRSQLIKAPEGGIPARAGMTPGMATCTIQKRVKDTNTITPVLRDSEPVEVDVYNWLVSVVCDTGSRLGIIDLDSFGTWWIEAADCSDL